MRQTSTRQTQETPEPKLRFIVPKNGHLKRATEQLLSAAGIKYQKSNDRHDYALATDSRGEIAPFEILFQRAADAIENVKLGIADLAVTGFDVYEEAGAGTGQCAEDQSSAPEISGRFNFSACSLWIAAAPERKINNAADLEGMNIATSYPNALRRWLEEQGVTARIITRHGGIEDYVRLGAADAICDIVETGSTLKATGLEKAIKLFDSNAVLIENSRQQRTGVAPAQLQKLSTRLREIEGKPEPVPARQRKAAVPSI